MQVHSSKFEVTANSQPAPPNASSSTLNSSTLCSPCIPIHTPANNRRPDTLPHTHPTQHYLPITLSPNHENTTLSTRLQRQEPRNSRRSYTWSRRGGQRSHSKRSHRRPRIKSHRKRVQNPRIRISRDSCPSKLLTSCSLPHIAYVSIRMHSERSSHDPSFRFH